MKKVLATLALGILLLPLMIGAQGPTGVTQDNVAPGATGVTAVPGDSNVVFVVISSIINWLFYILIIAAVFIIIWAAFVFLTAAGDPEKVAKARNLILYAIVAIVVAFLAKAVILLVGRAIGVQGNIKI